MMDIQLYLTGLIAALQAQFAERLVYVGLQGSYLRGEATEQSDIDIMTVIDGLSVNDLAAYRAIIESMEYADKSCGFICSKADLAGWNPLEIAHLLHTTKDLFGTLHTLVPAHTEQDLRNFIRFSVNNLYHEICHRYIHAAPGRSEEALPFTYKGVFFILQNLYFLRTGQFAATKADLLLLTEGTDRAVLQRAMALSRGEAFDFAESFELLFTWCQKILQTL